MSPEAQDIAVVGGGAAGLTAAYLLQQAHRVTLFEREGRLGGHAHTVTVEEGPDAGTPLDVAFMVLNDRYYPTFKRLLARLGGIATRPTEMSFGYQSLDGAMQYAINWREEGEGSGGRSPPPPLLREIGRFMRVAPRDLEGGAAEGLGYGAYLRGRGFSEGFVEAYAIPMGAALWSCAPRDLLATPAAFVLRFYHHHGLLTLEEGPRWETVVGGSRAYVERLRAALDGRVVTDAPPFRVFREADGVALRHPSGETERFDRVVIATHADQALALLGDPSAEEARLLGAWRYQRSLALLHTDVSLLPSDPGAWASWNYVQEEEHGLAEGPTLTYHLDRLQGLAGLRDRYLLSLNPRRPVAPERILGRFAFEHPVYDDAAVRAQPLLAPLTERRTHYCGAHLGHGFHEDAVRSGARIAESLGIAW